MSPGFPRFLAIRSRTLLFGPCKKRCNLAGKATMQHRFYYSCWLLVHHVGRVTAEAPLASTTHLILCEYACYPESRDKVVLAKFLGQLPCGLPRGWSCPLWDSDTRSTFEVRHLNDFPSNCLLLSCLSPQVLVSHFSCTVTSYSRGLASTAHLTTARKRPLPSNVVLGLGSLQQFCG